MMFWPSDEHSVLPSDEPSVLPSDEPSALPSDEPSVLPSDEPAISKRERGRQQDKWMWKRMTIGCAVCIIPINSSK